MVCERTHSEAPQPGVEPDAPLRPFCVGVAPHRQTLAVASNLHHRHRPKTLSGRDWGSRCRRSLRGLEFLEGAARGVNLLYMPFGMLREYTEQSQQRDGSAIAVLAG